MGSARESMGSLHEWQRFLEERGPGDHLAAWGTSDAFLQDLSARFLEGGLNGDETVFVVLPRDDLGALQGFRWRGRDLAALVDLGCVSVSASEDFLASLPPTSDARRAAVRAFLRSAEAEVTHGGRKGLRVLGRVAPLCFERGDDAAAEEIEEAVQSLRPGHQVLCLYRTSALDDASRYAPATRLCRAHTHTLIELPDGAVVCEGRR